MTMRNPLSAGLVLLVAAVALTGLGAACDSTPTGPENETIRAAVESISSQDLSEIVRTIAHDSMRGRGSRSPELEQTARYIAARFESFGLEAAGEDGYLQYFPLPGPPETTDQALNTIGLLRGSDPALRDEYVVITAHMDHLGTRFPINGDSIYNGADDNASGTAGIVELAEAFSMLNLRPRRSILFIAFGAEELGLIGSRYYTDHPTFPLSRTVANLNLDMIGRNWADTVAALRSSQDMGELAEGVAAQHPELGMRVVDDQWPGQNLIRRSDQWNFMTHGVPALFFHSGPHPDYHFPSDHADLLDYLKTERIVQLVFYIGLRLASADQTPD